MKRLLPVVALLVVVAVVWVLFLQPGHDKPAAKVGDTFPVTFVCYDRPNIKNVAGDGWALDWDVTHPNDNMPPPSWRGEVHGTLRIIETRARTHGSFNVSAHHPKVALVGVFTSDSGGSVRVSQDYDDELVSGCPG